MGLDASPLWSLIPVGVTFAWFAVSSVVLCVIDVRTHRLPDRIVLPGYAVGIGCFALAAALGPAWERLATALIGGGALFAFYLALRIVSGRGIGAGDVKLGGVVGLHLGWSGITPLVLGTFTAFLVGGLVALVLMLSGRATRRTAIAFGPFMLVGAWVAIVLAALAPDGIRFAG